MKTGMSNEPNRDQWIEKTLKNLTPGIKILDAGAGELQYKKYCNHLNYTSQDFGQYDGSGDNLGIQTKTWDNTKLDIISDITKIPVESESFDAVMCTEVLEHVPDAVAAIKELSRVLKKGGLLILTAPFCSSTHFSPYHFATGFNRYFYEKHLDHLNYEIIEMSHNGNFFEFLAQELLLLNSFAKKYTNSKLNIMDRICRYILLRKLKRLSAADTDSKELLCYGYHVLARKR